MNFSDPVDEASHITEQFNTASVEAARLAARPKQHKVAVEQPDGSVTMEWPIKDCVDCGEPIGEQRLEHGVITCTECQTLKEKRNARR